MTGLCGPIRYSQHELLERDRKACNFFFLKKGKEISKFILCPCLYTVELIFAPRAGVLSQMLLEIAFLI